MAQDHLNSCYRLLGSIQQGLGNPALTVGDWARVAEALKPIDDLVWEERVETVGDGVHWPGTA
jgi:hypothetical protein